MTTAGPLLIALAAAFALTHKKTVEGSMKLSPADEVLRLAETTVERHGFNADPKMLRAMAFIESSFNPTAVRVEPHINNASAGLMQTLVGTAQWLARDFVRYRSFGIPNLDDLMQPQVSMYFGAAYVDWLSNYNGARRSEEFIVRAYNGGPGNATGSSQTKRYYEKYLAARERFG